MGALVGARLLVDVSPAHADMLRDMAKKALLPDIEPQTALIMMLDARGVLMEIKNLSETPVNSEERIRSRSLMPGMAKRLREAGPAAPVVAALVTGTDKDAVLSYAFGGEGAEGTSSVVADPVLLALGSVLTLAGRGIREEALESPEISQEAIDVVNNLLDKVPKEAMEEAQEFRRMRRQNR